jgi:hypothetical protein
MDWSAIFELLGKVASVLAALAGGWWAFEKWHKREEHFPRVYFEVAVNFLGSSQGQIIAELVATLENKGVVPLKIRAFTFKLLGLRTQDTLASGGPEIRGQLRFPHVVAEGNFMPSTWDYTFIYPGVRTEYNYVCALSSDMLFVRMQSDFEYLAAGRAHHAAKVLKVPNPSNERTT